MAFTGDVLEEFLWRTVSLSPLAEKRLESEDYRHHLLVDEDGPLEQLYDLLPSLLQDLESIGVSYGETLETLMSSDNNLRAFFALAEYIFPSSLFLKLRDDKKLRDGLYHMLDGSNSDDTLNEWLSYIGKYDLSLYNVVEHFRPQLVGSGLFDDYLAGLHTHLSDLHISPILDPDRIEILDLFIRTLRSNTGKLEDVCRGIDLDISVLNDSIDQIEHLALDPEFAIKLSAWLCLHKNELVSTQIPFYSKLNKTVLVTFPLSLEYYKSRKIEISTDSKAYILMDILLHSASGKYSPNDYCVFDDDTRSFGADIVMKALLDA